MLKERVAAFYLEHSSTSSSLLDLRVGMTDYLAGLSEKEKAELSLKKSKGASRRLENISTPSLVI